MNTLIHQSVRTRTIGPLILLLAMVGGVTASASAAVVVVVGADSAVAQLSDAEVKAIFLGKKSRLPDGTPAMPVNQGSHSKRYSAFNQQVLEKDDSQIKSYWARRVFSGKGAPPPELANDAEVIDYIRKTVGGIGYISSDAVTGAVKVVYP